MLVAGGDLAPEEARAPAVGTVDTSHQGRPLTPISWNAQHWFTPQRHPAQPAAAAPRSVNALPAQPMPADTRVPSGTANGPQRQTVRPQQSAAPADGSQDRFHDEPSPPGRIVEGVVV
jgi:CDP-glycerol glycerophosphotransferase